MTSLISDLQAPELPLQAAVAGTRHFHFLNIYERGSLPLTRSLADLRALYSQSDVMGSVCRDAWLVPPSASRVVLLVTGVAGRGADPRSLIACSYGPGCHPTMSAPKYTVCLYSILYTYLVKY